jgi:hypothetical protein
MGRVRSVVGILMFRLIVFALLFVGHRAAAQAPSCEPGAGRRAERVHGDVRRGERFSELSAAGWILRLVPVTEGWLLEVTTNERIDEDLSRLTPPLHFAPNPREIVGWHFRNANNTGPNDGSVNAPQALREFIFSPRVGRDIQGRNATAGPTVEDNDAVRSFGRGWLFIDSYTLTPERSGERAAFETLRFTACLTWPE